MSNGGVIGRSGRWLGDTSNNLLFASRTTSSVVGDIVFGLGDSYTEQMRLTSTGLGIGTSSPNYKLDVRGTSTDLFQVKSTGAYTFNRFQSSSRNWALSISSSFDVYDETAAATRMSIDASGNLGLGVTPSAWSGLKALQIGTGSFNNNLAGDWTNVASNAYYDGTNWRYIAAGPSTASWYRQLNASHSWFNAPSGTAGNAISFTQAMTLDSNSTLSLPGKEGYAPLVIGSPPTFNNISSGFPGALISNNTSGFGYLGASGNSDVRLYANGFYGTSANHVYGVTGQAAGMYNILQNVHQWFNAPSGTAGNAISFTQAMTLDSSGNLGIGTTSIGGGANDRQLTLAGTSSAQSTYTTNSTVTNSVGSNTTLGYVGTTTNHPFIFTTNNTERARISSAGSFVAGAQAALATTATDGFLYVPTCAGTPTGTPTAITGMAPIVVNTTNNKLYFYSGGAWRDAGP
jgi:hypothetical protein